MSEKSYWANRYGIPESMVDETGIVMARRFSAEVSRAFEKPSKDEEAQKTSTNAQGTKLPEDIKDKLTKLVSEQTSLPVEFAAVLNDNFWDLL